jgi:hypothetical protein
VGLPRRGTHRRLADNPAILSTGAIIIAENREKGLSDSNSGACRISPLLMLLITGLASVRGYFAEAYKRE